MAGAIRMKNGDRRRVRDILKVARNEAGVYLFITPNGGLYVGSSIELYARVVSYFRPCTVLNADRHVLYHLKKNGFQNLTLILLVMGPGVTIDEVRDLEQYFIATLRPNLNEHEVVVRNGMVQNLVSHCLFMILKRHV